MVVWSARRARPVRAKCSLSLPAVRALSGIEFAPVTVVGDNGTGKSTVVEALARRGGFNAEGGSRNLRFETYATHSDHG
ncbi:MAG: hypothetical protein R2755_32990 [Acidimicrobiales bacterium]